MQIEHLLTDIKDYYRKKDWKLPNTISAALSLASEVGEVCDCVASLDGEWTRREGKIDNLEDELADTLMMLLLLANTADIDVGDALKRKMTR